VPSVWMSPEIESWSSITEYPVLAGRAGRRENNGIEISSSVACNVPH